MEVDLEGKQRALRCVWATSRLSESPHLLLGPSVTSNRPQAEQHHAAPAFSFSPHRKPVSAGEVDMHELKLGRITIELTRGTGKMSLAAGKREGVSDRVLL